MTLVASRTRLPLPATALLEAILALAPAAAAENRRAFVLGQRAAATATQER